MLSFGFDFLIEPFLIASYMFDQFFQNMFRRQSFEDISQFTSLEFQYLIVSVCVLLASKYSMFESVFGEMNFYKMRNKQVTLKSQIIVRNSNFHTLKRTVR